MTAITTSRSDVIWNYVGTLVSMASGFLLLPLLVYYLSAEELGLWYVFVAVSGLTQLFEFGFNPTFARNVTYVMSGARRLSREGHGELGTSGEVDWHLLRTVMLASRLVYAALGLAALVLVATVGSYYVFHVTNASGMQTPWVAWAVMCAAMFINLFFNYTVTILRGLGDVTGDNKSRTYSKIAQIALSAVLLACGAGLLGVSVAFLANGVLMRLCASRYLRRHADVRQGMASDSRPVSRPELRDVLGTVSSFAWRDGVVQLSLYASTQATSIICSLFLGLRETGTYSILLQFATAVFTCAETFARAHLPMFQSAFAGGDAAVMRRTVSRGICAYWVVSIAATVAVALVISPLMPLVKPGVSFDVPLFLLMCLYASLLNQHSLFCNFVVSMNEIPYMPAYVISSVASVLLQALATGWLGLGVYGMVAAQMAAQLVYNNWYWPRYVLRRLGMGYGACLAGGARSFLRRAPR